jgi:hypothetical protein
MTTTRIVWEYGLLLIERQSYSAGGKAGVEDIPGGIGFLSEMNEKLPEICRRSLPTLRG